ncbi:MULTISPECIES: hypothetical protein [Streptomyces]|uniref:hypothetical protein n=1 Tax=Streptomyces TaxID=1883 RepID=UPI003641E80D
MTRFSVDLPVPSIDGEWAPEAAAALVGQRWPLKATLVEGQMVSVPARVVAAQTSPDGVTMRLDLETDVLMEGNFSVSNISVDDD